MKKILILLLAMSTANMAFARGAKRPKEYAKFYSGPEITLFYNMNIADKSRDDTAAYNSSILSLPSLPGASLSYGFQAVKRRFTYGMRVGVQANNNKLEVKNPNTGSVLFSKSFTNFYAFVKVDLGVAFKTWSDGSFVDLKFGITPMFNLNRTRGTELIYDTYTLTPSGQVYHSPIAYVDYKFGDFKDATSAPMILNFSMNPGYQTKPLFGKSALHVGWIISSKIGSNASGVTNQAQVHTYKGQGDRTLTGSASYTDIHIHSGITLGLTF